MSRIYGRLGVGVGILGLGVALGSCSLATVKPTESQAPANSAAVQGTGVAAETKEGAAGASIPNAARSDPAALIGLAPPEIERLFGRPQFIRRDGPAEMWQFATERCQLNLFLYNEGSRLRVRHFELRERSKTELLNRPCDGGLTAIGLRSAG
jgi:hypothetical protein